jgi:hypothetical protein
MIEDRLAQADGLFSRVHTGRAETPIGCNYVNGV